MIYQHMILRNYDTDIIHVVFNEYFSNSSLLKVIRLALAI